jgi:hypothetical protein
MQPRAVYEPHKENDLLELTGARAIPIQILPTFLSTTTTAPENSTVE